MRQPRAREESFSVDWAKGLTEEQKNEIHGTLKNIPFLRETLLSIIQRYEEEESRGETTLSDYETASWAYKQADRNGARRAFKKVKALFNI